MLMNKALVSKGFRYLHSVMTNRPFPFSVMIILTTRCNYRCSYCRSYERSVPDPPKDAIIALIHSVAKMGAWRVLFSGGEALLRPDIGEILGEARRAGLKVGLVSNGLLVPERVHLLKDVNYVSLSVDGPKEISDVNRSPGAFEGVMSACAALKANAINVKINAVLSKHSATPQNVLFILDLMRRLGIQGSFSIVQDIPGVSGDTSDIRADEEAYRASLKALLHAYDPRLITDFRSSIEFVLRWPDYSKLVVNKTEAVGLGVRNYPRCRAGEYAIYIDADGSLYPCCLLVGQFQAKNVFTDGIEAAWGHAKRHECAACASIELNTMNYAFSLSPRILRDLVRGNFFARI